MKVFYASTILLIAIVHSAIGQPIFADDFETIKTQNLTNQVLYGERLYSLRAGLEEVYRPDANHSNSQLNLTDGEFYSTQVTVFGSLNLIWRARDAAVWFYVDMYSPGTGGFRGGEFSYVPDDTNADDDRLANDFFFKDGKFAVDIDGNGTLDSDSGEFLNIIEGRMVIEQTGNVYKLDFTFILENGVKAIGSFTGDFAQV